MTERIEREHEVINAGRQATAAQVAAALHGREYGEGQTVPDRIAQIAKAAGLIIVYGESDDLIEIRGAFTAEADADGGMKFLIDALGFVARPDETDRMLDDRFCREAGSYIARREGAAIIEALWAQGGMSWAYHTTLPHATFDIMEDGDVYCRGMVIAVADLPRPINWKEIAQIRQEKIQCMGEYFDTIAATLGVAIPETPQEGDVAVHQVMTNAQLLQWEQPRARQAIHRLRTVVEDANAYLNADPRNNIGAGSQLHRAFKDVLKQTELFRNPISGPTTVRLDQDILELMNLREAVNGTCAWTQPGDLEDSDAYQTSCDGTKIIITPEMERCPRCGKRIKMADAQGGQQA